MAEARVITDDAEALRTVAGLADRFAAGAADRDAGRLLPHAELAELSASGLLGITVPREFGGADVRTETLAEVFRRLAQADPNIAQIPHSHVVYLNALRYAGSPEQQKFFFGEVLAGRRIANAQSERGSKHAQDYQTRLTPDRTITGVKYYTTGALFADWLAVLARNAEDKLVAAYVPRDAPGVTVVDDWNGMGQRTTASGTVRLDGVRVQAEHVVPYHHTFTGPQLYGAHAQVLHAAIDVGIARGALADAVDFVRTRSRPWSESGVEHATEDPLTIQRFGELEIRVRAAEALLAEAGRAIDRARANLTDETAVAASLAVATAKAFADPVSVELGNAVFEVSGTRSAAEPANLNRHWRNARTHTLHDPVRWKIQHIGRYTLNGTPPPRHGLI